MEEKDRLDSITRRIIGGAIEVHRHLGPGLLESAYEVCLAFELRRMGFEIEQQKPLPVIYKDVKLDCGYRLDLMVEDAVVVEIKAVDHHQSCRSPISDPRRAVAPRPSTLGQASWFAYQLPCSRAEEWLEENRK
jgi:GxxExxY protein